MFVGIEDPIAIRRTLLQGSKEIITTLQRYEAFQYTQEMKIKELFILKNIMIEISKLGKSLEEALPVHHMGKKMEARKKGFGIRFLKSKIFKTSNVCNLCIAGMPEWPNGTEFCGKALKRPYSSREC